MEWDEYWPAQPEPSTKEVFAHQTTRLRISAFNPNLRPTTGTKAARKRGWPIASFLTVHFPAVTFKLTGAGVNKTVRFNPANTSTGQTTIRPTRRGTITIGSSGDHYISRTAEIDVLGL